MSFLNWIKDQDFELSFIVGGDFKLITSLGDKKGGKQVLEKFQEAFRDLLAHDPLIDLVTGVGWYTWNNNHGGEHLVSLRIDRFLVSEDIVRGIGKISASVLRETGSDPWPISVNWDWSNTILSKPFRFEKFWLKHKDFKDLVG